MRLLNYILISCFCLLFHVAKAQQEPQYTQFIYNKLGLNAGYAGNEERICLTALYRGQWLGVEGAPSSQVLSLSMPAVKKRIGLGLLLERSSVGISERWTANLFYSYRVKIERATLSLGVQSSIRYFGRDYTDDRLQANVPIGADGSIPVGRVNRYLANFGAGLYISHHRFYFGLSLPRLINGDIDFNEFGSTTAREARHAYLMGGIVLPLNENLSLQPQTLLKYVPNAPITADINLSLLWNQFLTLGVTYRTAGPSNAFGESIDLLATAQITETLQFGLAYDITLTELNNQSNGSIEALLRYCFRSDDDLDIINPRFF